MTPTTSEPLSRREREILDIVFARGEASAAQIREDMRKPPSYSAVRGLVRILEDKGHLKHRRDGVRNIYLPTRTRRVAGRRAMKRALETFFQGNLHSAVNALLAVSKNQLSKKERDQLLDMIEAARKEGR